MEATEGPSITLLLRRASGGDPAAEERVYALLYKRLRGMAREYMRGQPRGHTLQSTALVHEAWLRLAGPGPVPFADRAHFLASASRAMRSILIDHARGRLRGKRAGTRRRVPLDGVLVAFEERAVDILALDEALRALDRMDPRAALVVELRFFGGMTFPEVSGRLGIPRRTIERDWEHARAWLHRALS
jgi:RNA polymerase sigma factor (TIGR02999 family)